MYQGNDGLQGRSAVEQVKAAGRGVLGNDPSNYEGNAKLIAIDTQREMKQLENQMINGNLDAAAYNNAKQRYQQLADQVKQFDPSVRNWADEATRNAGTIGENPLLSNAANLYAQSIQEQQTGRNALALDTAADPLSQYRSDADLKRKMAFQNQANLAQNVRDQLTQLGNARQSNASLISNILGRQRQTF